MGNYPHHRQPSPVYWLARPGASANDAPLPAKTAARVRAIRQIFLHDFSGRATIDDIGAASEDAGLLDTLQTPRSMRECVMRALRPIATANYWESSWRPAHVSPSSPPG
jgi:hypothetical protein